MTTATGIGKLPGLLEKMSGFKSVQKAFEKSQLPLELIEQRDYKIPMSCMVDLFEQASREAGDRLFGLRVGGQMNPEAYGLWIRYSSEAAVLGEAILRLIKLVPIHQNSGSMILRDHGKTATWAYNPPSIVVRSGMQNADNVVQVMIRFIQSYLGRDWKPKWVQTCYQDDNFGQMLSDEINADWRFGGGEVSISFAARDLHAPRLTTLNQSLTMIDVVAKAALTGKKAMPDNIEALITLRLVEGKTDLDGLVCMLDTSVRTIQRELDRYNLTYRQLLDKIRFCKAQCLLAESGVSTTEISLILGYSDLAHFSRAFRRWSGNSPSSYRQKEAK